MNREIIKQLRRVEDRRTRRALMKAGYIDNLDDLIIVRIDQRHLSILGPRGLYYSPDVISIFTDQYLLMVYHSYDSSCSYLICYIDEFDNIYKHLKKQIKIRAHRTAKILAKKNWFKSNKWTITKQELKLLKQIKNTHISEFVGDQEQLEADSHQIQEQKDTYKDYELYSWG